MLVPEGPGEALGHPVGLGGVEVGRGVVGPAASLGHHAEGVVPQGVDLDGLAVARRDGLVAELHVHPGELRVRVAAGEQPVGVGVDVEPRAVVVAAEDVAHGGQELALEAPRRRWPGCSGRPPG